MDTFAVLYPQLQDIDFRDSATDFEVPVYFVQGAHEAGGRAEPFADWYPMITAPAKDLTMLDTSGPPATVRAARPIRFLPHGHRSDADRRRTVSRPHDDLRPQRTPLGDQKLSQRR